MLESVDDNFSFLDDHPSGIYLFQEGAFLYINKRLADLFGFSSPQEMAACPFEQLVFEKDWPKVAQTMERRLDGENVPPFRFRGQQCDGSPIWLECEAKKTLWQGRAALVGQVSDCSAKVVLEDEHRELVQAFDQHRYFYQRTMRRGGYFGWELDLTTLRFTYVDPQIGDLLGYTASEWVNMESWVAWLHPDDRQEALDFCMKKTEQCEDHAFEYRALHAEGHVVWIKDVVVVDVERGKPVRLAGFMNDITVRKEMETALLQSMQRNEKVSREKSRFLASMSHEIRTPLNSIISGMTLLKTTELDEEQREYVDIAAEAGHGLLGLIDQILDLSRIEVGRLELSPEMVDLRREIASITQLFKGQAREKGLRYRVNLDANLKGKALVDPLRIRQILVNVIGNAVKYTERGEVQVEARLVGGKRKPQLSVVVSDTGVGIAAERLPEIFAPFNRAQGASAVGSGLGLSIAKELLDLMAGEVSISSDAGKGTRVEVSIPFKSSRKKEAEADSESESEFMAALESSPLRVMVVEDNQVNARVVTLLLEKLGTKICHCSSGEEALHRIAREPLFDCVLMDLHMPGMDGFETTRSIRQADAPYARTPIFALTAHALDGVETEVRAAGMDGFLAKPLDFQQLQDVIKNLPSLSPSRKSLQ
ncbi:MAG: hypothetical protein C0621_05060 [Desulfuromonas sp.]|nr:MAG: hypothetical protein C0621_05060 [Desulfuromonas sp.]